MSQLVADYIDCNREAVEKALGLGQGFVSIAVYHLLTVPECVVVTNSVVDSGVKAHAAAVNRIPVVDILIKIVGDSTAIIGLVNCHICRRRIAFFPYHGSRSEEH